MKARKIVIAGSATLAACGVLGMAPPAVQASSASPPTWTQQHLAVHPPARAGAAMAYDAATGTAVLFGGNNPGGQLGDTWTWDGTTWTQQHPAASPPALVGAAMAYDAATGTVVLFGGIETGVQTLSQTWTWDGTTWTQQHPAASPPARFRASMAYAATTGTVVLFGGTSFVGTQSFALGDTWTWDGTTWRHQRPAASPPARAAASMAYDAATRTVVLFGGDKSNNYPLGDTWTWDGTTWTQQHPAASPPARAGASMAYAATTGTAVLFGGIGFVGTQSFVFGDTWAWDGTTWTQQAPVASPRPRFSAAMAYDRATRTAVLFGGSHHGPFADTWTWE